VLASHASELLAPTGLRFSHGLMAAGDASRAGNAGAGAGAGSGGGSSCGASTVCRESWQPVFRYPPVVTEMCSDQLAAAHFG
jgi:hypothetical protein